MYEGLSRSASETKMDKFNYLNPSDKSRTLNCYHNYQTRNLHCRPASASVCPTVNRLQLFSFVITLLILNLQLISASYPGQPQQAPPTSLTIKNNQKYNTTYACEGSQLTINCDQPGSEINVIRSNFGRFSISICNAQGILDWSVNCFSKNTVELIRRACNGQRQCLLQASTELFGNPCPNTYKYLEVHYECTNKDQLIDTDSIVSNQPKLINVNNAKPVDSLVNSNQINANSRELKRNSVPPSIIIPDNPLLKHHSANKQSQPSIPLLPSFTTPSTINNNLFNQNRQQPPSAPAPSVDGEDLFFNNNNNNDVNTRSTQSTDQQNASPNSHTTTTLYCPSVFERGLNWNRTEVESYVTQPCPPGSTGR